MFDLISALLSPIISKLIGHKKFPNFSKEFDIVKGKKLKAGDLLAEKSKKSKGFRKYYLRREVDKTISRFYSENKNILVLGSALSGKSRALYEFLRKTECKDAYIFIARSAFEIPKYDRKEIPRKAKILIVFNDINKYLNDLNFPNFIEDLYRYSNVSILATCNEAFENEIKSIEYLNTVFYESEVKIAPLTAESAESLRSLELNAVVRDKNKRDDSIGTFFYTENQKKKLFDSIANNPKKKAEFEYLRSYKCQSLFRRKGLGVKSFIREFANYRLKLLSEGQLIDQRWEEIEKFFVKNNFMTDEGLKCVIPESYLKIFFRELSDHQILLETLTIYNDDIDIYIRFVLRGEYSISRLAYQKIKDSFSAEIYDNNIYLYNALILSSKDSKEAWEWFNETLITNRNYLTYNHIISKAKSLNKAIDLYEEMCALNMKVDSYTFAAMIWNANTFSQAKKLYNQLQLLILPPKRVLYQLVKLVNSLEDCHWLITEFKKNEVKFNENLFYGMLPNLHSFKERSALYFLMKENEILPNCKFFESVFNTRRIRSEDLHDYGILMVEADGINRLSNSAYVKFEKNLKVFKSLTDKEADEYRSGISTTVKNSINIKNLEIRQAETLKEAKVLFHAIPKGKRDNITYNSLLGKIDTVKERKKLLNEMINANLKERVGPDTFDLVLNGITQYDLLRELFDFLRDVKISPGRPSLNRMLGYSRNFKELKFALKIFYELEKEPDEYLLYKGIECLDSRSEAMEYFDLIVSIVDKCPFEVLKALVFNYYSYPEGLRLIESIDYKGYKEKDLRKLICLFCQKSNTTLEKKTFVKLYNDWRIGPKLDDSLNCLVEDKDGVTFWNVWGAYITYFKEDIVFPIQELVKLAMRTNDLHYYLMVFEEVLSHPKFVEIKNRDLRQLLNLIKRAGLIFSISHKNNYANLFLSKVLIKSPVPSLGMMKSYSKQFRNANSFLLFSDHINLLCRYSSEEKQEIFQSLKYSDGHYRLTKTLDLSW